MLTSKEFRCFDKVITVCNNRGLTQLGSDILGILGPNYLTKEEIKQLTRFAPKSVQFADKISFLTANKFEKQCGHCQKPVEIGEASFVKGKTLYHVLCGLDVLGDRAGDNFYYKRWLAKNSITNSNPDSNYEEEI